jgi:hypothetical protein
MALRLTKKNFGICFLECVQMEIADYDVDYEKNEIFKSQSPSTSSKEIHYLMTLKNLCQKTADDDGDHEFFLKEKHLFRMCAAGNCQL